MYSVWTKQPLSVTLLGLLATVVIGYSFYAFFCTKSIRLKVFVLLSLVIGLWFGFETATRTPLIMFGIVYIVMGIIYIFSKRGIKAIGLMIVVSIFAALLYILYRLDVGGIKSAIWETPVFRRFEFAGLESRRIDIMQDYFNYMFHYLWGGGRIFRRVGMRAHNFLQEGHDMYGLFSMFFLVLITIRAFGNVLKLLARKNKSEIDFLLLSMYLSILIQLFLEPVFSGYPILLWCFLLIHGIGSAYLDEG